jgi:tetratricopeptide (TPR) repeat protein
MCHEIRVFHGYVGGGILGSLTKVTFFGGMLSEIVNRKPRGRTMTDKCITHSTVSAQWICPKCESAYCGTCVSKRASGVLGKEIKHFCPKCNVEADWVGVAGLIPPFWQRLHRFFVYPFYPGPLTLLVVLSLLFQFVGQLPVVGWLVSFLCWALSLKYAFEILKATGRGKLVPPKVDMDVLSSNFGQVFQQTLIIIVLIAAGFLLLSVTNTPGVLLPYIVFVLFFFPSIIILQVATGSVVQALNPLTFVQLAWRIGPGYLGMYFFLILMLGAPAVAQTYLLPIVPEKAYPMVFFFAQQYYLFVMYHLMGYVLLQYHNEIGYEVSFQDFEDVPSTADEVTPALSPELLRIELLIQEGKMDEALSILRGKANVGELNDLALAGKYYGLLKMKELHADMLAFSSYYLRRLLQEDKGPEATRVYQECLEIDQGYMPSPEIVEQLGAALEERGYTREALLLYDSMIKRHGGHESLPEMYFRAALIFNERMTQPEKARKLLHLLQLRYPSHPIQERVENYLKLSFI